MAKYQSTIEYNIKTNLDASGLKKLQSELALVENSLNKKFHQGKMPNSIQEAISGVRQLQQILNNSFNSKLGILDLSKLNSQLRQTQGLAAKLQIAFQETGAAGTAAATSTVARLYKMDAGLKSVSKTTDKIANTIGNTFRWGVIASAFASVMNAVHGAAQYTADLDKSLTNIMMVSGESRDNMNEFAKAANEAAQRMGSTTTAMTNATQIFVQQGLSLNESEKLAEYSVHLANVSGQDSTEAADEITAYKNAFKINLEDIENAISKWAAVANSAAVSVEELSVASQKAASVAKTVGVDMDQFAGHITAIEATTREAPENIGNGLKTLYSRISDIKLGETLEDGVDLGQFTTALQKVGVEALDTSGQLRDVGSIIEDLMARWGDLSTTEQVATATTVAGRFQLARFEALMNSADIYNDVVGVSRAETGTETYDRMQETFRDSMQGRMNALTASIEEIFNNLLTTDSLYPLIDSVQLLVDTFNNLIESVGGGQNALSAFGLVFGQIFNTQIARGVNNFIQNRQLKQGQKAQVEVIRQNSINALNQNGVNLETEAVKGFEARLASVGQYADKMTVEQFESFGQHTTNLANALNSAAYAEDKMKESLNPLAGDLERLGKSTNGVKNSLASANEVFVQLESSTSKFSNMMNGSLQQVLGYSGYNAKTLGDMRKTSPNDARTQALNASQNLLKDWRGIRSTLTQNNLMGASDVKQAATLFNALAKNTLQSKKEAEEYLKTLAKIKEVVVPALEDAGVQMTSLTEKFKIGTTAANDFNDKLGQANAAAQEARQGLQGLEVSLSSLSSIQSITNLALGIGQLGFAFESLKQLPEIWSDGDPLENLLESLTNIAFVLPMLTMGFQQLKEGQIALQEVIAANKLALALETTAMEANVVINNEKIILTEEQAAAAVAAKVSTEEYAAALALVNATEGMTVEEALAVIVAREGEITVTSLLSAKLKELAASAWKAMKPLLPYMAAIAGVAVIFGAYEKAINSAKEKTEESYQTFKAQSEILDDFSSYEELYDKYLETGEGADQLASSAKKMGESLGIAETNILAEAGAFDILNEKIETAIEKHRIYSQTAAESALRGLEDNINTHHAFQDDGLFYKYVQDELIDPSTWGQGQRFLDLTGFDVDFFGNFSDGLSIIERIGTLNTALQTTSKDIEDIKQKQNELKQEKPWAEDQNIQEWQELNRQLEEAQSNYDLINKVLKDADVQNASDIVKTQAEEDAQKIDWDQYLGLTGPEILEQLLKDHQEISDYVTLLGDEEGRTYAEAILQGALSTLDDGELKDAIQKMFPQEETIGNQIDAAKTHYTSDQAKSILADAGLEDLDLQTYVDQFREIGGGVIDFSNEIQTLNELIITQNLAVSESEEVVAGFVKQKRAIENASDSYDKYGNYTQEAKEALEKLDKEISNSRDALNKNKTLLERSEKQMQDLALASLQTDNALDKLSSDWEDLSDKLDNGNIAESSTAMAELNQIMADMLNIDVSMLPSNFVQEHLEQVQALANGDIEVLEALRAEVVSPIVQQVIIDTEMPEQQANELIELVNFAQSQLPDLEVGASLDDEQFLNELAVMVSTSQMSAEQMQAIFEAMGYDVAVTYTPVTFPNVRGGISGNIADAVSNAAAAAKQGAVGITWSQEGGLTAQIPSFSFVKKGGNSGGSTYKGNTGGSGGSKGGGGSGGKEPSQVSRTNPAETEKDIYNKVNAEMERLQDNYKRITRLRDNSYGSNFRKYSAQEIANLEAQNANLEKRQKITKKYIEALKSNKDNDKLNVKKTDTLGYYGLTDTDNDGIVDNYDSIVDKARAAAKKAQKEADNYFKSHGGAFDSDGNTTTEATMTEEESKHYKKLTETASNAADRVSGITDAVNKYQDAWDDARDTEEQIQENLEAIKQVQIEIFEQALKGIDNLKELNKQAAKMKGFFEAWDGTGKRTLSNSPFRALTSDVAELDGMLDSVDGKASTFFDRMQKQSKDDDQKKFWQSLEKQAKENGVNGSSIVDLETFALQALLDPNQAKQYFDLDEQEYHDVLTQLKTTIEDDLIEIEQTMEDLLDNIIAAYDDINERMEDRLDLYEREQDKLSHILNMTKIIYGDDYDKINEVLQKQIDAINIRASDVNKYIAYWQEQLDNVNEALKLNPNDPALQEQAKHLDATLENYKKQARDLIEEAAELADEKFSNALENAAKKFQDAMLSGNGRSYAWEVERWELAKEAADEYKDSVEKGYEIDKLRAKYQKLLDGSSTLKVQKQIKNSMQEQLAYLENQTNLSQFDVDLANAKLELLQKQIALEEAQRNKNQMRLRRDTQGNYGYVYAANNDDIADKQQEVLDSGYDIYEMSKSEQQRLTDESLRLLQDYTERYKQIAADKTLSDEERAARLEELAAQFKKRMEALNADFDDAIDGMIDGAKILAEYAADDVAEYFDAIANTTKDNWEETMDTVGVAYSDTIRNMATDTTTFEGQVDNFANDINTALDEFDENVTSTAESFGENFDDISDDVQDVIDQMQDLNSETAKFLDLIADDTKKISKAQQKLGDYQATLEGLTETSSALREALDEANKKLKKAEEDTLYWKAKYNEAVKPKSSGSSGSGGGSNSGGNNAAASKPELKPGAYATLKSGHVYHYSSYGDSPTGNYNAGIKDGVVIQGYSGKQIGGSQTAGPYYIALHGSGKNGANTWQLGWVKPEDLEGYDTGGYTGAWGTEGRAALLHEKELVLNKDDTENMLAAIKLVRDMVSIIQTPTLSSAIGGITQALNDTIEQRVEVTAEFPNATDADDIRSAILSLADDAFQYAYSTR